MGKSMKSQVIGVITIEEGDTLTIRHGSNYKIYGFDPIEKEDHGLKLDLMIFTIT